MGWTVLPPAPPLPANVYVEVVTFSTSESDCKEVIKVKWGCYGEPSLNDWCPRRQRDDHAKIKQEASHLQAEKSSLRRNHACWFLDLGLLTSSV